MNFRPTQAKKKKFFFLVIQEVDDISRKIEIKVSPHDKGENHTVGPYKNLIQGLQFPKPY